MIYLMLVLGLMYNLVVLRRCNLPGNYAGHYYYKLLSSFNILFITNSLYSASEKQLGYNWFQLMYSPSLHKKTE
jgi:hypothetical protein